MKTQQLFKHVGKIVTIFGLMMTNFAFAGEPAEGFSQKSFESKLSEGPVAIQFHKKGCGTCASLLDSLNTVRQDPAFGKIAVLQVDIQTAEGKRLMKKYGVDSQAVLALFRQGDGTNPALKTQKGHTSVEYLQTQLKKVL